MGEVLTRWGGVDTVEQLEQAAGRRGGATGARECGGAVTTSVRYTAAFGGENQPRCCLRWRQYCEYIFSFVSPLLCVKTRASQPLKVATTFQLQVWGRAFTQRCSSSSKGAPIIW